MRAVLKVSVSERMGVGNGVRSSSVSSWMAE